MIATWRRGLHSPSRTNSFVGEDADCRLRYHLAVFEERLELRQRKVDRASLSNAWRRYC